MIMTMRGITMAIILRITTMDRLKTIVFISCIFLVSYPGLARACDICSLYSAMQLKDRSAGSLTLSVTEQFTDFKRASADRGVAIRDGEVTRSFSTTQLGLMADISDRLAVQLVTPIVNRRADSFENFRSRKENDYGLGDMSFAAHYTLIRKPDLERAFYWSLSSGVKLPTGSTGALEDIEDDTLLTRHHSVGGGGGRVLTRGTGSYDFMLGTAVLTTFDRWFINADTEYTYRTEGDFSYEFADDVQWSVGTGYQLILRHDYTIGAGLFIAGEHKGNDRLAGQTVARSKVDNVFVGPELLLTLTSGLQGFLSAHFPISDAGSETTLVPRFRARAGLSYRFSL